VSSRLKKNDERNPATKHNEERQEIKVQSKAEKIIG
jgi:hypothetical protein